MRIKQRLDPNSFVECNIGCDSLKFVDFNQRNQTINSVGYDRDYNLRRTYIQCNKNDKYDFYCLNQNGNKKKYLMLWEYPEDEDISLNGYAVVENEEYGNEWYYSFKNLDIALDYVSDKGPVNEKFVEFMRIDGSIPPRLMINKNHNVFFSIEEISKENYEISIYYEMIAYKAQRFVPRK